VYCAKRLDGLRWHLQYGGIGLVPSGDFVLDGDPAPPKNGGHSPQFSAHVYCGQTAIYTKMSLGTEVGLGPGDMMLDGDPATQKGHSPFQSSAHVYCGQTAGWIKMSFGMEVDLGPGHIVLDGDPVPPKGAQQPPPFRSLSTVATVAHLRYC